MDNYQTFNGKRPILILRNEETVSCIRCSDFNIGGGYSQTDYIEYTAANGASNYHEVLGNNLTVCLRHGRYIFDLDATK